MIEKITDAATAGNIEELYVLIGQDAHILDNFDNLPFVHTPLHVAAHEGQVGFAMEMMRLKPSFATKLNQNGFSPMHLALRNRQTHMAMELLKVDEHLIRVKGKGGVTPLHIAAGEGHPDLLAEFLVACPDCIRDVTSLGATALHSAVEGNRLDSLEILIGWLGRTGHKEAEYLEMQILNRRNNEGNTALHLAVSRNRPQMVKLLAGCQKVNKNIRNRSGLTPLGISQRENNREIRDMLVRTGSLTAASLPGVSSLADFLRSEMTLHQRLVTLIARRRNSVPSDARNALVVVAGLIITATYQTAISPPGGVSSSTSKQGPRLHSNTESEAMDKNHFYVIWCFNTLAFWTTFILLAIFLPSGHFSSLFLTTLAFLGLSHTMSMVVVAPKGFSTVVYSVGFSLCMIYMFSLFIHFKWKPLWNKKHGAVARSELALEGLAREENVPPVLGFS